MSDADPDPDAFEPDDPGVRVVEITPEEAGERLDKTLAAKLPELSRARVQALLAVADRVGHVHSGDA